MLLDIRAYSKLIMSEDQSDEGGYEGIRIWRDSFDYCELEPGHWEESLSSRRYSFRAGAYSSYNWFIDTLCKAINGVPSSSVYENLTEYSDTSFIGIIYFSDCDGFIGPKISGQLYQDFVDNRERVIRNILDQPDFSKETLDPLALETEFSITFDLSPTQAEYFIDLYDEFTEAFRIASDEGVLIFC